MRRRQKMDYSSPRRTLGLSTFDNTRKPVKRRSVFVTCSGGLILVSTLAFVEIAIILVALVYENPRQAAQKPEVTICYSTSAPGCVRVVRAMNKSVNPCEDFYHYACGGFEAELRKHYRLQSDSSLSPGLIIHKTLQQKLKTLLTEEIKERQSSVHQKARRFYKSCVEAKSGKILPGLREMVAKMGGLWVKPSRNVSIISWSLNNQLAIFDTFIESALFYASVVLDQTNSMQNIVILGQGSLALPFSTRDFYINKNVTFDHVLTAFTDMLEKFARFILGKKAAIDRRLIVDVLEFDKKRAEIQLNQAELLDRLATFEKVDITWLEANIGFINWTQYLRGTFAPLNISVPTRNEPIIVYGISYFKRLNVLVNEYLQTSAGKRTLQNYFVFKAITIYVPSIGGRFQKAFDVLSGNRIVQEPWERCLQEVDQNVGFPLGAIFVEKFFSHGMKVRAEAIVSSVAATFRSRIQDHHADWMDEKSRLAALKKIDRILFKIGYPDWLLNETEIENRYSKLAISDDYLQNKFAVFTFKRLQKLSRLREVPDRHDWPVTPQTINAFYDPSTNTVTIPAGILTSPFFYGTGDMPLALNFGTLGSIVGHEIAHAFDYNGLQYDELGNLRKKWWKKETLEIFLNRSNCFARKHSLKEGDQRLSEIIADNIGIKVAYEAFKQVETNVPNSNQLFFVGYAQKWCSISKQSRFHSHQMNYLPNHLRVTWTLSNLAEFSSAFNCMSGSQMDLVDKKCAIW